MPIPTINQLKQIFQVPDSVIVLTEKRFLAANTARANQSQSPQYNIDQTIQNDSPLYTSGLGTPVYSSIEFLPGTYETNTKGVFKSFGSSIDGPDRLRYEAVLLSVSQQKKIIKTEIQGRDGTVKEYIGMDDYEITVNGVITGANGHRPIDEIIGLKKMLDAPIPIEVASAYLQALDIHYLVLDNYTLEETEGGYSFQKFSLNFISDIKQELSLVNV